jgi:hypothetical protein
LFLQSIEAFIMFGIITGISMSMLKFHSSLDSYSDANFKRIVLPLLKSHAVFGVIGGLFGAILYYLASNYFLNFK